MIKYLCLKKADKMIKQSIHSHPVVNGLTGVRKSSNLVSVIML